MTQGYYFHWVDTSARGLFVYEGVIRPMVSVSALTWFIRYISYSNLQFLNNVVINQTKVPLPQAYLTVADIGYLALLYLLQKIFELIYFQIFRL